MKYNFKFIVLILITVFFSSCKESENGQVEIIPLAPSNLTATASTQVTLQWTDNSTNELGFKIERKTNTTNFSLVGTTGKDVSNFNDTIVALGTNYTYRVFSYNKAGNSANYSNEVSIISSNLPTLTTNAVSYLGSRIATCGGSIPSNGGMQVTARGVCWSTNPNPTIALNTKTSDGQGNGNYNSNLTNLTPGTKYYVRAYAINALGTNYGNELNFTTAATDIATCFRYSRTVVDSVNRGTCSKDVSLTTYTYEDRIILIDQNGAPINALNDTQITAVYKWVTLPQGYSFNWFNQGFIIKKGESVSDIYRFSENYWGPMFGCEINSVRYDRILISYPNVFLDCK